MTVQRKPSRLELTENPTIVLFGLDFGPELCRWLKHKLVQKDDMLSYYHRLSLSLGILQQCFRLVISENQNV